MKVLVKQGRFLLPLVLISGCANFVPLKPGAESVNIYTIDNVKECEQIGSVQVNVMYKIGPINRDPLAVENELNTLAKNSAFASGGDTAIAASPVKDGARDFNVYKCKK